MCDLFLLSARQMARISPQSREDLPAAFYRWPRAKIVASRASWRWRRALTHMQVSFAGATDFDDAYQRIGPLTRRAIW